MNQNIHINKIYNDNDVIIKMALCKTYSNEGKNRCVRIYHNGNMLRKLTKNANFEKRDNSCNEAKNKNI